LFWGQEAKEIVNKLVEAAFQGEVLPPQPSLEDETEACLQMIEQGRQLHDQLKRANNRARRLNEQIDDLCLALGHKLVGMRKRVEAGEAGDGISWWQWFEHSLPDVSRKHAERWLSIAAQIGPATAAVEYRDRDAAYHRAYRAKQKQIAPLTDVRQGETELPSEIDHSRELDYQPATPSPTASLGDRSAMRLYSTLGALQSEYLHQSPADVAARMTDEMRPRLREVAPLVAQWLWAAAQAAGFKPERKQ
jgi:hypothetical protein